MNVRAILIISCLMMAVAGCSAPEAPVAAEPGHASSATDFERGPHRGRLLRDGDFAVELQIFEDGVQPEFHVYLFRNDQPLPPTAATVSVQLTRVDNEVNTFTFEPVKDFLRGNGVVNEPHSFSVVLEAQADGKRHRWTYDSFEGRTIIPAATAQEAGIVTEVAGPARIADVLSLTGRITPNEERMREVTARFPGPVRTVLKSVGDTVKAGETMATVESNDSLQVYAITAPISGTVIERHTNPGETTGSEPLFVIADYGSLWAELGVFPREVVRLRTGQPVRIRAVEGETELSGTLARIAPSGQGNGLYTARVRVDNGDRRWVPGQFVRGDVEIGSRQVPLAVKRTGLQTFRDFTVVFQQVGETYEVCMLELGQQDNTWVEVTAGLKPGSTYVSGNSYLIKADIEKSGASHDH